MSYLSDASVTEKQRMTRDLLSFWFRHWPFYLSWFSSHPADISMNDPGMNLIMEEKRIRKSTIMTGQTFAYGVKPVVKRPCLDYTTRIAVSKKKTRVELRILDGLTMNHHWYKPVGFTFKKIEQKVRIYLMKNSRLITGNNKDRCFQTFTWQFTLAKHVFVAQK